MKTNIEKFKSTVKESSFDWINIVKDLEKKKLWLDKSEKIAADVVYLLKKKEITKQNLAEKIGVSRQYINKIVKGKQNLTLETISKLEDALEENLIEINDVSIQDVSHDRPAAVFKVVLSDGFVRDFYNKKKCSESCQFYLN